MKGIILMFFFFFLGGGEAPVVNFILYTIYKSTKQAVELHRDKIETKNLVNG